MPQNNVKVLDLNQFIYKNNRISWKESIGLDILFYFNNEKHSFKLLEKVTSDHYKVIVDEAYVYEKVHTTSIKNLCFPCLSYNKYFKYDVGQIINGCTILKQLSNNDRVDSMRRYIAKCNIDGYEFETTELKLNRKHGCPVCYGRVTLKGYNDIATTDPELVCFFADINDAYTHTRSSGKKVTVKCPFCGFTKIMCICDLTKQGHIFCDICSNKGNNSYPNLFARELFRQLRNQYKYYEYEYSPNWANLYRYDNYIEFSNGVKLVVEMDGVFHKISDLQKKSDSIKDSLAKDHDIIIIRIDSDYKDVLKRCEFIKNKIVQYLSNYFDLSCIDWNLCDKKSLESKMIGLIQDCNANPKIKILDLAKKYDVSEKTVRNYIHIGESLGLCKYMKDNDLRFTFNSKPIAMYDSDNNLIGIFKSSRIIAECFIEKHLDKRSIRRSAEKGTIYKGCYFRFASYEEYLNY